MGIICSLDSGPLLSWARCWLSAGKWVGSSALSALTCNRLPPPFTLPWHRDWQGRFISQTHI